MIPRCTYRLQFNRNFTFRDATALVPYLKRLGVSHVYASPFLKARPGSTHGYDIVDHGTLNPELGDEDAFDKLVDALEREEMGLVLDVVPNHMGVGGSDNAWWLDVLENGPASPYADYFDIDWTPVSPYLHGKILIPVLGDHYGEVLARGEISLAFAPESGGLSLWYFQHRFPLDPGTYADVLGQRVGGRGDRRTDDPSLRELESVLAAFRRLPPRNASDGSSRRERARVRDEGMGRLRELWERSGTARGHIEGSIASFNDGKIGSEGLLHGLLERQAYRLAHWKVAADEVNYRRFFDINDLAAVRVEDETVFRETHRLITRLVREGMVQGLRIDHPDGLNDPGAYLRRLREELGGGSGGAGAEGAGRPDDPGVYVVAEKILAPYEDLPDDWPVQGTTGYDFMNLLNGLFVDPEGERRITAVWQRATGERISFEEELYRCKRQVIRDQLSSEFTMLSNLASGIAQADRRTRDFTLNGLRSALEEVIACFPVYRTYVSGSGGREEDRRYIEWALARARKVRRGGDTTVLDFLRRLLLSEGEDRGGELSTAVLRFSMKVQQVTAPVMAKGLEDTASYRFNRLVSLNDVGGEPGRFGVSVSAFHQINLKRARQWPHSMLATTTHDTKRSEDVRARINVLSECPDLWKLHVGRWRRVNRRKRSMVDDAPAPSGSDEYLLYQTLVGAWPLEHEGAPARDLFRERMAGYVVKAAREAKRETSWQSPNEAYEVALVAFLNAITEESGTNPFLRDFLPFQRKVAIWGMLNSLSQTLLKFTAPGVPDIYQGNECRDLSLVDPDNRRPVDFGVRGAALEDIVRRFSKPEPAEALRLAEDLSSGAAKLFVVWLMLQFRARYPDLFREGDYIPAEVSGPKDRHVCAFARSHRDRSIVVIAPRFFARLTDFEERAPLGTVWEGTEVELPESLVPGKWTDLFTGRDISPVIREERLRFPLGDILTHFPVAVVTQREPFRFGPSGAAVPVPPS